MSIRKYPLTRQQIGAFINSERGIRAFEGIQDDTVANTDAVAAMDISPAVAGAVTDMQMRIAALESLFVLPDVPQPFVPEPPIASMIPELMMRLAVLENAVAMLPVAQPLPGGAPDGTYASPTSITIRSGVITAIS